MFQKLFLVIFILLSISLGANDGIPQERGQKVSLQLLWKHQFEFAGFYIAKEKGFYKDNNLEVELKEYQFGVDITKDVESGESTFGVGYPSLILDKANGSNIVLLNSIYQSSPHILITLKSSGIKSIEEFKNKKIMIENNTIKAVPFMGMLFSKGIKKEDVNILKPTFDIEDLIQGKTDIFAAYISNEVYKLNKKDLKYNIWNPADYGFDFYNDILFTSSKMLKNDNSKVKRFQEASLKGWRYAFAHIDETVELILNKYNTQNKTKEALLYEAKTLKKLAYKGNISFGDIDKNKIQRIYDIYNLMGLTNNKIDLDTFLYCPNPEHILLTKKERQYLKDNPIITVHNEQNWPPYNFNENGKAKGFSIDYIKLVAQKLGIKIKFIDGYTWNEFMDMVKTNKIDILLNTIKTKSREESLNFTTGYTNSTKFIFTNDNNIKTLDALKGKIVAVTEGFFIHKFLEKNYPSIKLNIQNNTLDCIYAVINKEADAIIGNFGVVNYILQDNVINLSYSIVLKEVGLQKSLHLATAKNNLVLKNILQKGIDKITDQEINNLKNKWLGFVQPTKVKNIVNLLTNEEKDWIKNNRVKVGIENWKPIMYFDKELNTMSGIGGDILKLLLQRLGMKSENIINQEWDILLNQFKDGDIDILPTTYHTKDRANYGIFTQSYLDIKEYLYIKSNNHQIKTFKDLKNKRLAIIREYGTIPKIREKYPTINIIETSSVDESISLVLNGKVDALYDAQLGIEYHLLNHAILGIKGIAQDTFKSSPLHMFSTSSKPILSSILKKGLKSITKQEKNRIVNRWINIENKKKKSFIDKLLEEEQKYLKTKKIIRMCNNPNYAPIEFAKNNNMNNMSGIAIDTLKILEGKLNIKFQNVPTKNWSESQQFLKDKKCDILPAAIKTKKRENYANFTKPYLNYKLAIITKNDIPIVNSLEDIIDKPMARKKGSGLISKLKIKYPNIQILETEGYLESLLAVEQEKVTYTIATLPVASYYISKFALYDLHIAGYTDMTYNLSIAVRDDDKMLLNILDKALLDIDPHKMTEIEKSWTNIKLNNNIDYSLVYKLTFAIFIIGLFFIYREYMLKKSNLNLKHMVNEQTAELQNINKILAQKSYDLNEVNENLAQKVVFEIEKAKKMEHKYFEREKMAAMGEMIGNIAHQWRQPLSMISTSSTGILMQHEYGILTDEKLIKSMEDINSSAQFLSKTIDDFRDIVKGDADVERFNLTENLEKCLNIELPMLKVNNIELIKNLDDAIEVESYPNALIQSMINIINNAKDILKEKNLEYSYIFIDTFIEDKNAVIMIKDNAGGIPLDVLPRIFEAYFTTKHKTQGTGLGLNMTYNMVSVEMNGKIEVKNINYKYNDIFYDGALFIIRIPLDYVGLENEEFVPSNDIIENNDTLELY